MRKWAKSWENLLKAEVNKGKIRGSLRKHSEAPAVQKSVALFEGGGRGGGA
jgi:hypothetical protein